MTYDPAYHRAWRKRNRVRYRPFNQVDVANRNARRAGLEQRLNRDAWLDRLADYGYMCAVCWAPYDELEHIIPLGLGGSNSIENIRPICGACHDAKTRVEAATFGRKARGVPKKVHPRPHQPRRANGQYLPVPGRKSSRKGIPNKR